MQHFNILRSNWVGEARIDIVGKLPLEIGQLIFGFLSAEEVGRCCLVCKRWREIANYDALWRRLCIENGIDLSFKPTPDPTDVRFVNFWDRNGCGDVLAEQCSAAKIFGDTVAALEGNWSRGRCARWEIGYGARGAPRIGMDGQTLALSREGGVALWTLRPGAPPSALPSLSLPLRLTVSRLLTDSKHLVAVLDSATVAVFTISTNAEPVLMTAFYRPLAGETPGADPGWRYKRPTEELATFVGRRGHAAVVAGAGLYADGALWVRAGARVGVWQLSPFEPVGSLPCAARAAPSSFGNLLFVACRRAMRAYDGRLNPVRTFRLPRGAAAAGYVAALGWNGSLVAAVAGESRGLKAVRRRAAAWDGRSGMWLGARRLGVGQTAFLHPGMDALLVAGAAGGGRWVVRAWAPRLHKLLWATTHAGGPDAFHFGSVGRRFLLFFAHLDRRAALFDAKSGRRRPLPVNPGRNSSVVLYSDQSLILADTRSHRCLTVFSFLL